jgi:hypothetical protein
MHEQCADVRRLVHPESGCKRGMRIIDRTASPIPPLVDFSAITDDVPISDTERARLRAEPDPRAVAARYDRGRNVIVVVLGSGLELSVSRNHFPSLRRASSEELDQVTVAPRGGVLVWHNLDEHYSVRALVGDLLGG